MRVLTTQIGLVITAVTTPLPVAAARYCPAVSRTGSAPSCGACAIHCFAMVYQRK